MLPSPPGESGLSSVRASGLSLAARLFPPLEPPTSRNLSGRLLDRSLLVAALR
jgi:hypothetical protein